MQAAGQTPISQSSTDGQSISTSIPFAMAQLSAQIAHESGELRYTKELASGRAYEGRKDPETPSRAMA